MPSAVDRALLALLHVQGREPGDPGADAAHRFVPEASVLRRPSDGPSPAPRGCAHRPPPCRPSDAPDGAGGLPGAAHSASRAPGLLRTSGPTMSGAPTSPRPGGDHGLGEPALLWRLSNTLDASFCVEALDDALTPHGPPEIFNTDQGSQFTGYAFTGRLRAAAIRISMDGRVRCMDNIFSSGCGAAQIRGRLSARTRRRLRGPARHRRMDRLLQHREAALGARRADADRGIPRRPPVDRMDKPLRALPTSPQAQHQRQGDRFKGILAA